ncbi:hypothetical protein [Ruminococcus sp. NK3A76]|uniref:hypothetical protein n=1 Tax=Ruminococcus sp. NK3A76 TaxID=877411 RepID=UPI000563BE25|nr:hypothetical protein [Ruminococcus sp. NK3A76]
MKKMKRLVAVMAALAMSVSAMAISSSAEDAAEDTVAETDTAVESTEAADTSAGVYVTIHDKDGDIALANTYLDVTDTDGDGALTIVDALYTAHEHFYEGGAEAGFAVAETDWGTSLVKLWGEENGGSYGYYVNNASSWSMKDPIKDGDLVSAFVYTDTENFSDAYSFFDKSFGEVNADKGETIDLTLSYIGYDADWNPVTLPLEGAYIVLNGEKTGFVTDADGKVTVDFMNGGDYIVSAVSDKVNLVSPVLTLSVLKTDEEETPEDETEETVEPSDEETEEPSEDEQTEGETEEEPETDESEEDGDTAPANDNKNNGASTNTATTNPKTSSQLQLSLAGIALAGVMAVKFRKKR